MKHFSIIILILITTSKTYCQTKFGSGFRDGYKVGYCYYEIGPCDPPYRPITLYPSREESLDDYFEGYNQGLLEGINQMRGDATKHNSSDSIYKPFYEPIQYKIPAERFKPNWLFYEETLSKVEKNNMQQKAYHDTRYDSVLVYFKENEKVNYPPETIINKYNYINFVKTYYNSFEKYPKAIPDGWHKITSIIASEYHLNEGLDVYVENNRIAAFGSRKLLKYLVFHTAAVPVDSVGNYFGMTESDLINEGKARMRIIFFEDGKPTSEVGLYDIYFFDYLLEYNDEQ